MIFSEGLGGRWEKKEEKKGKKKAGEGEEIIFFQVEERFVLKVQHWERIQEAPERERKEEEKRRLVYGWMYV